jgi:hypothetical protein
VTAGAGIDGHSIFLHAGGMLIESGAKGKACQPVLIRRIFRTKNRPCPARLRRNYL